MKKLIPLLLAGLALSAFADDDKPDDAAKAVFQSFEGAWRGGDEKGLGSLFDKDSKVSMTLSDTDSGSSSKDQAIGRLKAYFASNKPTSLKLTKDGYRGGSNPSASYDYEYTDGDGHKQKATLFVSLVKKGDRWVVKSIQVID